MRTRLQFATESAALTFAASVHTRMAATHPEYSRSVLNGQTLRWAIPYQDEGETNWSVNVKTRCGDVLTAQERSQVVNGMLASR